MRRHEYKLLERLPDVVRFRDIHAATREAAILYAEHDNPGFTVDNLYKTDGVWRVELWRDREPS